MTNYTQDQLIIATVRIEAAAHEGTSAIATYKLSETHAELYSTHMLEKLKDAADVLGFDLIERQPAAEAAE